MVEEAEILGEFELIFDFGGGSHGDLKKAGELAIACLGRMCPMPSATRSWNNPAGDWRWRAVNVCPNVGLSIWK